jgi:hypothetical protein
MQPKPANLLKLSLYPAVFLVSTASYATPMTLGSHKAHKAQPNPATIVDSLVNCGNQKAMASKKFAIKVICN